MLRQSMDLCTINTHYQKSEILTSHNKLTIVEGMSVAFTTPKLYDLLIYFHTNSNTELERRFGRDIEERGADVNYLKQSHNQRRIQYEVFMHPYSKNFDIIIKSTEEFVYVEEKNFNFKLI